MKRAVAANSNLVTSLVFDGQDDGLVVLVVKPVGRTSRGIANAGKDAVDAVYKAPAGAKAGNGRLIIPLCGSVPAVAAKSGDSHVIEATADLPIMRPNNGWSRHPVALIDSTGNKYKYFCT